MTKYHRSCHKQPVSTGWLKVMASLMIMCPVLAWAIDIEDIHIRDPFILPVDGVYYLYRSSTQDGIGGVEVFRSRDLKHWDGPKRVLSLPEDNWATGGIWAPEVHAYNGKYYLFATCNTDVVWRRNPDGNECTYRGTQIFWSDSPEGPFHPFGRLPHTPMDEMALDGTLWVEDGVPYMIYCHEWVQTTDGEMKYVRLADDLSKPEGQPVRLFNASAAEWSTGPETFVTDGCFLYRTKAGKLLMLWSSFMNGEYAIGIATSVTGKLSGPWRQADKPLFSKDGGHGMVFRTFDGSLCLVIHSPNSVNERARIFELEDTGDTLILK